MQFTGAVIRDRGLTFAVVIVRPHEMSDNAIAERTRAFFQPHFPGLPIVLASKTNPGEPFRYQGPPGPVAVLSSAYDHQIPWSDYIL